MTHSDGSSRPSPHRPALIEEYAHDSSVYSFWRTGDGSPTVSPGRAADAGECMHHSDGALSETLYIYGTAVRHVLERGWAPRFLVVGLGLGMIEMTVAALAGPAPGLRLVSYESDPVLSESFRRWVEGRDTDAPAPFARAYSSVAAMLSERLSLGNPRVIRERLRDWLNADEWRIHGALGPDSALPSEPVSAILFDAYSKQTSPELWDEAFLTRFLSRAAGTPCVLATYAAQGSLKRALAAAGFSLEKRAGFSGKRESTFAVRA